MEYRLLDNDCESNQLELLQLILLTDANKRGNITVIITQSNFQIIKHL